MNRRLIPRSRPPGRGTGPLRRRGRTPIRRVHEPPHSVRSPLPAFPAGGGGRRRLRRLRCRTRSRRPRVGRLATSCQAQEPPRRLGLHRHRRPGLDADRTPLRRLEELPPPGRRPYPLLHVPQPRLRALLPPWRPRDQPHGPGLPDRRDPCPDAPVRARAGGRAARLRQCSGPVRDRSRWRGPRDVGRDVGRRRATELRVPVAPLRLHRARAARPSPGPRPRHTSPPPRTSACACARA